MKKKVLEIAVAHIGEDYGLVTVEYAGVAENDHTEYEVPRGLAEALRAAGF